MKYLITPIAKFILASLMLISIYPIMLLSSVINVIWDFDFRHLIPFTSEGYFFSDQLLGLRISAYNTVITVYKTPYHYMFDKGERIKEKDVRGKIILD